MNYLLVACIGSPSVHLSWCLARDMLSVNVGAGEQGGVRLRLLETPVVSSFSKISDHLCLCYCDYRLHIQAVGATPPP